MNQKNYLTEDLIPKSVFQKILIGGLMLMTAFIIYSSYQEFQSFKTIFEDEKIDLEIGTYEIGYLRVTKLNVTEEESPVSRRFITVIGLSYPTTIDEQIEKIQHNSDKVKLSGLVSHPSFLISDENESFWKSQFYWIMFLFGAGPTLASLLFVVFTVLMVKQKEKLFTKEIKYGIHTFFWLIMGGLVFNSILFGRMIYFLNNNYGLGEKLTAGISNELLTLATALLVLIVFIERAIPIQEEQDLTV